MSKRVFVSADWKENESNPTSCDKMVVERIYQWAMETAGVLRLIVLIMFMIVSWTTIPTVAAVI